MTLSEGRSSRPKTDRKSSNTPEESSLFVELRDETKGFSKSAVQSAWGRLVREETKTYIQKKLLKDSVFFQENVCRPLPVFDPTGKFVYPVAVANLCKQ